MGLSPDKSIPMAISVKVSRMDSDFLSKNIVKLGSHLSVCRKYNRLVTFGFIKFTKELPYWVHQQAVVDCLRECITLPGLLDDLAEMREHVDPKKLTTKW